MSWYRQERTPFPLSQSPQRPPPGPPAGDVPTFKKENKKDFQALRADKQNRIVNTLLLEWVIRMKRAAVNKMGSEEHRSERSSGPRQGPRPGGRFRFQNSRKHNNKKKNSNKEKKKGSGAPKNNHCPQAKLFWFRPGCRAARNPVNKIFFFNFIILLGNFGNFMVIL